MHEYPAHPQRSEYTARPSNKKPRFKTIHFVEKETIWLADKQAFEIFHVTDLYHGIRHLIKCIPPESDDTHSCLYINVKHPISSKSQSMQILNIKL